MSGGNIKVVVRCRPLNSRELARGATCLIRMEGNQTIISKPPDHKGSRDVEDIKAFTFDKSYWSADKNDPTYATQDIVYNDLGEDLLNHAFDGYNCCIFAYGQTGSGKSYSMMGYGEDKGIIPKTCLELFNRINDNQQPNLQYRVEVSYIEIYNEKVRDLLNPKNKGNLKVREHPSLGPYVEDLSRLVVNSFDDINHLMDEGNKSRTVAATNMNETSSRSHAVFTLFLTQTRRDEMTKLETEKVARISLVDLAGSERANSTGATGARLKEGANINKSLTTLGKVISGLADQSIAQQSTNKKQKEVFIPYRDSVLTWLLKDSLGGNSKTAMIAAISPADYDETLSTLRYADQAKKIQNKAVINEDPNAKMIRELKEELDTLRTRLRVYAPEVVEELTSASAYASSKEEVIRTPIPTRSKLTNANQVLIIKDEKGVEKKMTKQEVVDQLTSSEKLLANLNQTWEQKLKRTEEIHFDRENALKDLGITIDKNDMGIFMPKEIPFIVNLNEDPLMSECLMYQIKLGKTRVGKDTSTCEIRLSGSNIQEDHCWFQHEEDNTVTIYPSTDAMTMVNGIRIQEPRKLRNGYRIILGHHHIFRFNHPEEVRRERDSLLQQQQELPSTPVTTATDCLSSSPEEMMDWNYARLEAMKNHYSSETSTNFNGLKDEEIEKLYDDIGKIRSARKIRLDDDGSSVSSYNKRHSSLLLLDDNSTVDTETSVVEEKIKDYKQQHQRDLMSQKKFYQEKLSKISSTFDHFYTVRQTNLIKKVFQQWKNINNVSMAEIILENAILLKEANILAVESKKDVLYQFTVVEKPFSNTKSFWEEENKISNNNVYQDENDMALENIDTNSTIGIRVIDEKNQSIYIWSLTKFKSKLSQMRQYNTMQYKKSDPFYESPKSPKYSFVGNCAVSIRNLYFYQPYESCVEILCRVTGQVKGKLRLLISPVIKSVNNESNHEVLHAGQQLLFEIRLLELIDVNEQEFTQIHVQYKLSSFNGNQSQEKIFATNPITTLNGIIHLNYSQTLSILITDQVESILLSKLIIFEIYGIAQPKLLSSYKRWDDQREKPKLTELLLSNNNKNSVGVATSSDISNSTSNEDNLLLMPTEKHDILAWIQILELTSNGEYVPVQVIQESNLDRGVFNLRQGLQRRIVIKLVHTSGRQFIWNKISIATIGQVRLLDIAKNRIISSPQHQDILIKLLSKQEIQYNNDGTSLLIAQGAWDSSQHDCLFLNKPTQSNTRILLNLKWEIETEKCLKPIQCSMDIAIRIQSRDFSNFGLKKLLGSNKYLTKCSGLFLIQLRPPMTRRASQLWRLNTATRYIQNEEFLGSWRPRSVSLIHDFNHIQTRIRRKEQVTAITQTLMLHTARSQTSQTSMAHDSSHTTNHHQLIKKVLDLWSSKWGSDKEIMLCQDPPIPGMQDSNQLLHKESWNSSKLLSEVKLITEFDNATKKGYLTYQENALDDKWVKRWFVLKKPYIHIYSSQSETEEQGVINVSNVRIDYNRAIEQMIKRNNVFSLYTNNNAYILQANSKSDMTDWMKNIDISYSISI